MSLIKQTINGGGAKLQADQDQFKADVRENLDNTSKGRAFLQHAGREGYGVVQVLDRLGDAAKAEILNPERLERTKETLNNPESPYSPKNHFTNGGWSLDPQPSGQPTVGSPKPADEPRPKAPWQGR